MKKEMRIMGVFSYFLLGVMWFLIILVISSSTIKTKITLDFNQLTEILSPYLTEQQEEEYVSRWALMKNRAEYLSIISDFEMVASQNNILLPEKLTD